MWPDSCVKYHKNALPAHVLEGVCADAEALSHADNYRIPKERILAGPSACTTPAELAVCLLYQQHVAQELPDDWLGAEYWVQVYKPGAGLKFHFDKDEHLLKATGEMSHPIWSSILYLTGSSSSSSSGSSDDDWDGARQAATVILQQFYDTLQHCARPTHPDRSVIVWPKKNCYCLFDGRLRHGVLNSSSSSSRATLLVNWWNKQPMVIHELPDSHIEQLKLTRLRTDEAVHKGGAAPAGSSSGSSENINRLHCCQVTVTDLETDGVQMVDAVAAANKMHLTGPAPVDILAFEHPGMVLYPIESTTALMENYNNNNADQEQYTAAAAAAAAADGSRNSSSKQQLQTLAAFVSLELIDDDISSSSSSKDE